MGFHVSHFLSTQLTVAYSDPITASLLPTIELTALLHLSVIVVTSFSKTLYFFPILSSSRTSKSQHTQVIPTPPSTHGGGSPRRQPVRDEVNVHCLGLRCRGVGGPHPSLTFVDVSVNYVYNVYVSPHTKISLV